jgi:Lectin C-type domain
MKCLKKNKTDPFPSDYNVEHFWVAAESNNSAPGGFSWVDGTEVRLDAWAKGYPKIYDEMYSCVSIGLETSKLFNFDCSTRLMHVCFVPL